MKKLVKGIEVEMSEEEIVEFEQGRQFIDPLDIPQIVSRTQLLTALVMMGFINSDEALKANFEVPSGVLEVLSDLSSEMQIAAKIKWLNFTEAHRSDPLVQALTDSKKMTKQEVDEFFTLAGSL